MPNWCNNDIRIYGGERIIKILTNVIKSINEPDENTEQGEGEQQEGLFKTLIGIPPEMPKDEYNLNWYDTNIAWFGTKWDVHISNDCFIFSKVEHIFKIKFNVTYELSILKFIKMKFSFPSELDFILNEGEIEFSCETAWSPPIEFLVNLCKMYKVSAYIFYSEPGMAFSGETKLTWEDGELSVEDNEYEYKAGLYHLSKEEFWCEMDSNIEYAVEEDMDVDEFIEEYKAYASEKDIQDIITMFNEQKKAYDEQQSEVE